MMYKKYSPITNPLRNLLTSMDPKAWIIRAGLMAVGMTVSYNCSLHSSTLLVAQPLPPAIRAIPQTINSIQNTPPTIPLTTWNKLHQRSRDLLFSPWHLTADEVRQYVQQYVQYIEGSFNVTDQPLFQGPNYGVVSTTTMAAWKHQALTPVLNSKSWLNANAIITTTTNLYALPVTLPLFEDPTMGGGGYPFDQNIMDVLYANAPVRLLCQVGQFAFIITNAQTFGWIKSEDVMALSPAQQQQTENYTWLPVKNNGSRYLPQERRTLEWYAGMWIPVKSLRTKEFWWVQPKNCQGWQAYPQTTSNQSSENLEVMEIAKVPQAISLTFMRKLLQPFLGEPYGWGRQHNYRDCSAFVKDYFALLGIFLPRNSRAQSTAGIRNVNLAGLSPQEKLKLILTQGKPFFTTISAPGHIVLYVGKYRNQPLLFLHSPRQD